MLATRRPVARALTRTPLRAVGLILALGAAGWAWALAERATIVG